MSLEEKDREILRRILEKRSLCIPLSPEEERFASDLFDKLISSKRTMAKRNWYALTGDQLRKIEKTLLAGDVKKESGYDPDLKRPERGVKPTFEGTPPKERGFEGGYSKPSDRLDEADDEVDLDEAKETEKAGDPTRPYEEREGVPVHDEVDEIEGDDTEGKPEEYDLDADDKEHKPTYEEERREAYTRERAGVIKVGDIVVRDTPLGKEAGVVLNVSSKGGLTVLWKSTMTQTFETPDTVRKVYKAKTLGGGYKGQEKKISPPIGKRADDSKVSKQLPEDEGGSNSGKTKIERLLEWAADRGVDEVADYLRAHEGMEAPYPLAEWLVERAKERRKAPTAQKSDFEGAYSSKVPKKLPEAEEISKQKGNIENLIEWAAGKTHTEVAEHLRDKEGVDDPEALANWLIMRAKERRKK
jgi:hypothetical protein